MDGHVILENPEGVEESGSMGQARLGLILGGRGRRKQWVTWHFPFLSPTPTALNKQKATLYSTKYTGMASPIPGRFGVRGAVLEPLASGPPASDRAPDPVPKAMGWGRQPETGNKIPTSSEIPNRQVHLHVELLGESFSAAPRPWSFLRNM